MEFRRRGYAVVYVILLCALAFGGSEGKRWIADNSFFRMGRCFISLPEMINHNMAGQMWIRCKKDAGEDFDLFISKEAHTTSVHLTGRNTYQAVNYLPPNLKLKVLDCIKERSAFFSVPEEEAVSQNLAKCLKSILGQPNAVRKFLVDELPKTHGPIQASRLTIAPVISGPAPADQAPAISNSRRYGPSPAFDQANTGSSLPRYGPAPQDRAPASSTSPGYGPAPVDKSPSSSPSPNIHPRSEAPIVHTVTENSVPPEPPPHPMSPPHGPSKKKDDSQKATIIIAVASTFAAVALFFIVMLVLCCPYSKRTTNKDDRPLLNLSDFSAGSSQKSITPGNSDKEFVTQGGNNTSLINNSSTNPEAHETSTVNTTSPEDTGPVPVPPLKLPPGRSDPPPPPRGPPPTAPPPPPPRVAQPPPPAPPKPKTGKTMAAPLGLHNRGRSGSSEGVEHDASGAPKTKLKPFFWDKVLASPDQSMVWHEISAGSFQFNEEMMESLFGYTNTDANKNNRRKDSSSLEPSVQYIQIIESKKAQNLSILLRALNVTTEEILDALREGNEIPVEFVQTLLKMAPSTDEELKLRLFAGDLHQLSPADRFLKALIDVPFAFKRLECLLFMSTTPEEVSTIKESFATLEVACNKIRKSRLFLKLLEAVLKTGNRMNDGTYRGGAQAFKLDTLLKLADVKGTDGKTTLLHFVVQEIIRSEGIRAIRRAKAGQSLSSVKTEDFIDDSMEESEEHYRSIGLQVVSGLSDELRDVKKAAVIDADGLTAAVSKLGQSLIKVKDFLGIELKNLDEDSEFHGTVSSFVNNTEADIQWLMEEEKRITALVKSTADCFHGNAGRDEGLRLFMIVRDFLIMLDKACKEVRQTTKPVRNSKKDVPSAPTSPDNYQKLSDIHKKLFPAIRERRMEDSSSSSDDETLSPSP